MKENILTKQRSAILSAEDRIFCAVDVRTDDYPISEQFDIFRDAHLNVMEIDLVRSRDTAFSARQIAWDLGRMVFVSTELPGRGYAHRRRHLRKAALDHWYMTIPVSKARHTPRDRGRGPAVPSLHCLASPFEAETEDDAFLSLFLPRDLFASIPALHDMLGIQVDEGCGRLLANYLLLLDASLPELRQADVPHVLEATRHLVAACLAPSRDRLADAQRPIDTLILEQGRKVIARRLADPDLSPEILCTEIGVSRSRLYRLFEPFGGVSAYIRHQRLLKTREALADSSDHRSISRIAEEWGFMDPSAYSRAFKRDFGISPSEAREEGWVSGGSVARHVASYSSNTKGSLGHLLRALST